MPKTSHFFLLCSVLAVPFLGSSSAHAFTIINQFGQCLEDRGGDTTDRTPIVNQICSGRFPQQWNWDQGSITGIPAPAVDGSGGTFPTCLTAFGSADGTPVTLVTCHAALRGLQKWIRGFPGQIINVSLSKCLAVEDPTAGTQMTVRACDPNNPNQSWALRS
jgi:ricin-type beta-trefoil lectin protein